MCQLIRSPEKESKIMSLGEELIDIRLDFELNSNYHLKSLQLIGKRAALNAEDAYLNRKE